MRARPYLSASLSVQGHNDPNSKGHPFRSKPIDAPKQSI